MLGGERQMQPSHASVQAFSCLREQLLCLKGSFTCFQTQTPSLVCCCSFYGEQIPGHVLADRIASYVHLFNLYWYLRWACCDL